MTEIPGLKTGDTFDNFELLQAAVNQRCKSTHEQFNIGKNSKLHKPDDEVGETDIFRRNNFPTANGYR